jgi:Putative peptidoglycan binding domain
MKQPSWPVLAIAVVLAGACAHTKTTDDGTSKETKPEANPVEAKETKPRAAPERHAKQGSELHPGDRDATPVATAPAGLLVPGAADKIRERLVAGGFLPRDAKSSDAAMREGLKRFQRAKDLPATGVPDHETVKRLGLDPDQTFRQGVVKD